MRKILVLIVCVVILGAQGLICADWNSNYEGKISWVGVSSPENQVAIEVIDNAGTQYLFWCPADSVHVPLLMTAYQTQSVCHITSPDDLGSGSPIIKELGTVYISRAESTTNEDVKNLALNNQSILNRILIKVNYIYNYIRRILR